MQTVPPNFTHPDLTPERLTELGQLMDLVWTETRRGHNEDEGDGPWGFGCRYYDRLRTRIRRLSKTASWLRVIERSMHFVFTVGAVPIRFYRGTSRRAKAGYLVRREPELRQHQLAFGPIAQELDWVFRIAIEAMCEDARPRLLLVKQEVSTGQSECLWEIVVGSGSSGSGSASRPGASATKPAASTTAVRALRKSAVKIAPPKVGVKRNIKKRSTDDGDV